MREPILYRITRPILGLFFRIIYRPTYLGLEHLNKEGRFILAGNHTNNFDCLLLISSCKRTIHFLAKEELTKGMKKVIFKNMGIIPVNRKIHDSNALKTAIATLEEEKVIGIFPEGTFTKGKDVILPFKIGAVKMAKETKSPIIPFTITGKYRPFKKGLTIAFYGPYYGKENLEEANEELMNIIRTELVRKGLK